MSTTPPRTSQPERRQSLEPGARRKALLTLTLVLLVGFVAISYGISVLLTHSALSPSNSDDSGSAVCDVDYDRTVPFC